MRVLAVTNLYPNPFQPHLAPFNRQQLRLLAERGPVRIIAPILWTDEWKARRAGAAKLPSTRQVTHDGLEVHHPRYWYTPKVLRGQYGRFFLRSIQPTFTRVFAEFRPDVVFTPWPYPDGWAAGRLAHKAGVPVVVQVHGSDVRQLELFPKRTRGTIESFQNADGIVAVSQDLADRIVKLGIPRDKIRVNIDGVDRDTFCPGDRSTAQQKLGWKPGGKHILSVGNLLSVKGPDVLLDACARLLHETKDWQLHMVGSGPLKETLIKQAARLGITDHVQFHGPIPHAELPDWFRAADLFVLASRSEGIPTVLLEAASCGCPFVATRVGGIPEIAHLAASRLVPSENPEAFSRAILGSFREPQPQPAQGPRDRREAVSDLAAFLQTVIERYPNLTSARSLLVSRSVRPVTAGPTG